MTTGKIPNFPGVTPMRCLGSLRGFTMDSPVGLVKVVQDGSESQIDGYRDWYLCEALTGRAHTKGSQTWWPRNNLRIQPSIYAGVMLPSCLDDWSIRKILRATSKEPKP